MPKNKDGKWKNKEWLYNQYINLKKTSYQIAEEYNCSRPNITYWLRKFDIPIREPAAGHNEKNINWKGDKAGYLARHTWIRRHKQKLNLCEICNESGILELSNISGEYKRDINDWQWVHHHCHVKYDIDNDLWGKSKKLFKIEGVI